MISMLNSCSTDQNAQRSKENHAIHFFLNVLASMTGRCVYAWNILEMKYATYDFLFGISAIYIVSRLDTV